MRHTPSDDDGLTRSDAIDLESWEQVLAGEATSDVQARIRSWVTAVAGEPPDVSRLRAAVHALETKAGAPAVEPQTFVRDLWAFVAARTMREHRHATTAQATAVLPPWHPQHSTAAVAGGGLRRWPRSVGGRVAGVWVAIPAVVVALAAAVVVALGASLVVLRHGLRRTSPGRQYATTTGQRLSVTLVDGTQVTLAPASRVRLAAAYGRGAASRDIELEGEAYFSVAHDAAHPFAVRANGVVVRDVGTAFDVRAYPEDARARIAVADGAVAISVAGDCQVGRHPDREKSPVASASTAARKRGPCSADAKAGDVATVGGGQVALEHEVDVGALAAWRNGHLVFDATPTREVLAELARWYDVDVQLSDSTLGAKLLTATLDTHDPAQRVFEAVAFLLHAHVERRGRVVAFSSQVEHPWR